MNATDVIRIDEHPIFNIPAKKKPQRNPFPPKNHVRTGRNDPCSCGSGKKHKKCCLR